MEYIYYYKTLLGLIGIASEDNMITNIYFNKHTKSYIVKETKVIKKAYQQIIEYCNGTRKEFDLPLNPKGTLFQKKVWLYLQNIPYGATVSYKEIAIALGDYKKARAVGMANHSNPIPIIIPCHRVIGINGSLIGYAGGLENKIKLLELERFNK